MIIRNTTHQLPLVIDKYCHVLILGSFPSIKSQEKEFYYMHPQNRFYKCLSSILNEDFLSCNIKEKTVLLLKHHIALYDVIESCEIENSSDSKIKNIVPCNLEYILQKGDFNLIALNGNKANQLFKKYFPENKIPVICLKSTSPANARENLDSIIENWKQILNYCN